MRISSFINALDTDRALARGRGVYAGPAGDAWLSGAAVFSWSGQEVFDTFGYLLHFVERQYLPDIFRRFQLGRGAGVWCTPSPTPTELLPYSLGLGSPRDFCLVLDPRLPAPHRWWGPGVAPPSSYPNIWTGGGLEFYTPDVVGTAAIVDGFPVDPGGYP